MIQAWFLPFACGWTDNGHMLVAQIAKDQLAIDNYSFLGEHFYSKEYLAARSPDFPKVEDTDDLAGIAVWMDNVNLAFSNQHTWHFSDVPYSLDGTTCGNPDKGQDILWALRSAIRILTMKQTKYEDPAAFQFFRGYWIRVLVHLLGDLHQPLHNMNGCSKRFPHGDRGGNDWEIVTDISNHFHGHTKMVSELHLLWDLGGGKYMDNWPLNDEAKARLEAESKRLQIQYSKASFDDVEYTGVDSFKKWHDGAYAYAKDVYNQKGTPFGKNITFEYLESVQQISQSQITVAGYRLASVLRFLPEYKSNLKEESHII